MKKLQLNLMFMKNLHQLQLLLWLLLPMLAILSPTPCQLPPRLYQPPPPMPLQLPLTTLLLLRLDASTMLDLWFHVPSNCTLSYHFHYNSAPFSLQFCTPENSFWALSLTLRLM